MDTLQTVLVVVIVAAVAVVAGRWAWRAVKGRGPSCPACPGSCDAAGACRGPLDRPATDTPPDGGRAGS